MHGTKIDPTRDDFSLNSIALGRIETVPALVMALRRQMHADVPVYLIYSFNTLIGWVGTSGAAMIPVVHWSTAIGAHQAIARQALGIPQGHATKPAARL